jgi:methyltransferase family protein
VQRSLVPFYKLYHEEHGFYDGLTISAYIDEIGQLIKDSGAKTILDYGCGKGYQYKVHKLHKRWPPVKIKCFDPAVDKYAAEPNGQFDGVICCDVLEHIPRDELPAVLAQLVSLAKMWLFIAVCCRKADHDLPNGQNEHVIIEPQGWWLETLDQAIPKTIPFHLRFTP